MALSARTFAMASSLDLLIDAIIALARGAVNTYPRAPADTIQKRNPHDVQENHTPGPPRRGGEIQELGQVGPERRDRHAQLYDARGHHRGGATRAQRQGDLARAQFRSYRPAGGEEQLSRDGPHQSDPHHDPHRHRRLFRRARQARHSRCRRHGDHAAPMRHAMDGLGHIFYESHMWNGYDCREVTSAGAQKCGIEKTKSKMVGRGVFLDVARALGKESLEDGYGITCEDLNNTAEAHGVTIKRGDYVIVRTGQMERCLKAGSWDGYPGGDAPGLAFETLEWVARTELAALASDTWGCEVRPNETEPGINQPWHWITIPIMGMTMGEIFNVKELADDCAADKVYEFMFVAPAIPITGAVGSPTNPLAIK